MTSRLLPGTLLLLVACGGGGFLYTTLTASPASAPADVFECAKTELKKAQFQQTSLDVTDLRITAKKDNYSVHSANSQFLRSIDKLEVDVGAGADGKAVLKVVGHTFAEYNTVRGATLNEEKASDIVNQAAQAIIQACGQQESADSTIAP